MNFHGEECTDMPGTGNIRRRDFKRIWQNGQSSDKNVLRNIIFSYLLIMVVIVGIWIVSMRQMSRVIASQNETIYKNVLEVLSMSMDKDLALMERTALNIALSNEAKTLLSSWKEERGNILQIRGPTVSSICGIRITALRTILPVPPLHITGHTLQSRG